jgi:hypothetical protein
MGFVSLAAGYALWREQGWAEQLSRMVLGSHGLVFLSLAGMQVLGKTVAANSIGAMLFRTAIWTAIALLVKSKSRGQEGKEYIPGFPA